MNKLAYEHKIVHGKQIFFSIKVKCKKLFSETDHLI